GGARRGGRGGGWAVPARGRAAEGGGAAGPAARVASRRGLLVSGGPAPWWPDGEVDHVDAAAGAAALGRALAWRLSRWDRRAAAAEALAAGADPARLRAEDSADEPTAPAR